MDAEAAQTPEPLDETDADDATPFVVVDGRTYEFPGCRARHVSKDEFDDDDCRVEFWDAETEMAMEVRDTSPYHESPSVRLAQLIDRIAATRGSDIEVLGSSSLTMRDSQGNRQRVLEADQVVYTHPMKKRPMGATVEVEAGEWPDVVLEVDVSTDVRRGKLGLYEKWRFPEVWVEVPVRRTPSGLRKTPGLTIYLYTQRGYMESPTSSAFPSWSAQEIHAALNEDRTVRGGLSPATANVVRRVGRLMRGDTGTGPDDDPFLRAERAEGRMEAIEALLKLRGLYLTRSFAARAAEVEAPIETLLRAAQECTDEDDFFRRIP